ncbi:MAG: hypothetical protein ACI9S9_003534, partial [Planctomycetota bacterium]
LRISGTLNRLVIDTFMLGLGGLEQLRTRRQNHFGQMASHEGPKRAIRRTQTFA